MSKKDKEWLCQCGSGKVSAWQFDARGIPLCRTCPDCHQKQMMRYRPDVLVNPNYWTTEDVDPDD